MRELQPFRTVRSHQAHGIIGVVRCQWNHSPSLAKVVQVLDPFAQVFRLGGCLFLTKGGKLQSGSQDWGLEVEAELFSDQLQSRVRLSLLAADFLTRLAHGLQHCTASSNLVEY